MRGRHTVAVPLLAVATWIALTGDQSFGTMTLAAVFITAGWVLVRPQDWA